ncbi:serine/threonine protein kinase [Myxococcota bacterium]|nr:serine/threonine protein kinase [Myxococcota bacterium]
MSDLQHYCSACLTSLVGAEGRCPRAGCERPRPRGGWPRFFAPGEVVGERYSIRGKLGAGGAGVTYRAVDLGAAHAGRVVALKVLHQDRAHGVLRERLRLEGQVLRRLDHPHVVAFRDLRVDGPPPYWVATDWVPGGTLDRRVRYGGPLGLDDALELGRQLALGLAHAHAAGIVHRDLKPANVLIQSFEPLHARIVDYGIARAPRDADYAPRAPLTVLGGFVGTPEYAAPEQLRGEADVGPAADVFALGVLLHDAAGGAPIRTSLRQVALDPDRLYDEGTRVRREPLSARFGDGAWEVLDEAIGLLVALDPRHRPTATRVAEVFAQARIARGSAPSPVAAPLEIGAPAGTADRPPEVRVADLARWRPAPLTAPGAAPPRPPPAPDAPATLLGWRPTEVELGGGNGRPEPLPGRGPARWRPPR